MRNISFFSYDTLVIGTGCAGYNAADSLFDMGRTDVAILTEGVNMGTSRNTGSDKQTYYKLSLCSDSSDSIYEMAENLFAGGSVNGDTALAEAAGSVRAFMKLVNLGVPFPTNIYGEYVGYKTDHDPRQRATSCGPLTSKIMTEKLEAAVAKKDIPIYDGMQVIKLIVEQGRITGVIALDLNDVRECSLVVFLCNQVILATGGPAIAYENSVYPESQTGMTGTALLAGAPGCNLQEWQYGLASTKFRWNVSGTYQQVLPRYISVDQEGNEYEFLPEYFDTPTHALDMVFLKGYQWPFDSSKTGGSSLIDILVHHEIFHKGRRVYMDFTKEPMGLENGFEQLCPEAFQYLSRSHALVSTPIARLKKMNPKAIELYASHDIDLTAEPLEVSVCAQHCNGGLAVDLNWQTPIQGLYVAGEAAGTFGVARPGGSALNSTQVGSLRAAEHIAFSERKPVAQELSPQGKDQLDEVCRQIDTLTAGGTQTVRECRQKFQSTMSLFAAHIRSLSEMERLQQEVFQQLGTYFEDTAAASPIEIAQAYKNYDMLAVQSAMLSAMKFTAESCGSRGSALIVSPTGDPLAHPHLAVTDKTLDGYRYLPSNGEKRDATVETVLAADGPRSEFRPVRPLPKTDDWFENVWQEYDRRRTQYQA